MVQRGCTVSAAGVPGGGRGGGGEGREGMPFSNSGVQQNNNTGGSRCPIRPERYLSFLGYCIQALTTRLTPVSQIELSSSLSSPRKALKQADFMDQEGEARRWRSGMEHLY